MKTGNVVLGVAVGALALWGLSKVLGGKSSTNMTAQQKADDIISKGGADVTSSFMGMPVVKQSCADKCASLGFGVLRNDPCYCKQEKNSRADGMTMFMNA